MERGAEAPPLTQGGVPPLRLMRTRFPRRERSNEREAPGQTAFVVACIAFVSRDDATHSRHRSLVLDVSLGCAESNLLRFFSVAEKRSLTPAFKNDEYEVRKAAGTMDPLTPNRVAFPGLAGVACRS